MPPGSVKGTDNDFAERLKLQRLQSHVNRRRTGTDRVRVPSPQVLSELRAIGLLLFALVGAERPRFYHLVEVGDNCLLFFKSDMPARGKGRLSDRRAAMPCQPIHAVCHRLTLQGVFKAVVSR